MCLLSLRTNGTTKAPIYFHGIRFLVLSFTSATQGNHVIASYASKARSQGSNAILRQPKTCRLSVLYACQPESIHSLAFRVR